MKRFVSSSSSSLTAAPATAAAAAAASGAAHSAATSATAGAGGEGGSGQGSKKSGQWVPATPCLDVLPPPLECVIDTSRPSGANDVTDIGFDGGNEGGSGSGGRDGSGGGGSGAMDRIYGRHCLEREAAARAFFCEHDAFRRRFLAVVDVVELDKAVECAGMDLRTGCRSVQTLKTRLKTRWRECDRRSTRAT